MSWNCNNISQFAECSHAHKSECSISHSHGICMIQCFKLGIEVTGNIIGIPYHPSISIRFVQSAFFIISIGILYSEYSVSDFILLQTMMLSIVSWLPPLLMSIISQNENSIISHAKINLTFHFHWFCNCISMSLQHFPSDANIFRILKLPTHHALTSAIKDKSLFIWASVPSFTGTSQGLLRINFPIFV